MASLVKNKFFIYWRDALAILTILLLLGSLVLIAYGVNQSNRLAQEQRDQINCIAQFYADTGRANRVIEDINICSIKVK